MIIFGKRESGFTLIEAIITIVLLGVVAGVLAPLISNSFSAYSDTRQRVNLMAKGRLAIDRLAREIRQAAPNSLDLVGNGLEFIRTTAGGRYITQADNFGSAFRRNNFRFRANVTRSGLYVAGTDLGYTTGQLLIIGNTSATDLRSSPRLTAVVLNANSTNTDPAAAVDNTDQGSILSFNNFTFNRSSPGYHYQIADAVIEVGLSGSTLRWHESTNFDDYNDSPDWGSTDPILVSGITNFSLSYNAGTPFSSGILQVDMTLTEGDESIRIHEEIHVRNTP